MRAFILPFLVAALLFAGVVLLSRARQPELAREESYAPKPAGKTATQRPSRADVLALLQAHPLVERRPTPEQRTADIDADFRDAIVRIEGVFDPTRIGVFGAALRMQVRPGTASMTNIYADAWRRADADPNLHYRVRYLATVWLAPGPRDCDGFSRLRPDEALIGLDRPRSDDCVRLESPRNAGVSADVVAAGPLTLPVFCAPYPGARLTIEQLHVMQEARMRLILASKWFR